MAVIPENKKDHFETQTKKINEPTIKIGEIINGKNIKFEGSLNID
jgi:hypothetical protein